MARPGLVFRLFRWSYPVFGIWDGAYVVLFYVFLIQLNSPGLGDLNQGTVRAGVPGRLPLGSSRRWSMG